MPASRKKSHRLCFIADSLNVLIACERVITVAENTFATHPTQEATHGSPTEQG